MEERKTCRAMCTPSLRSMLSSLKVAFASAQFRKAKPQSMVTSWSSQSVGVANIKREIVNAKLDYSRMLSKVTFVGIYGGKEGAALERRELAKLRQMFDSRQEITDIHDLFIKSMACCLSCGMKDVCFPGWSSGLAMLQACVGRYLLCTPIKQTRMQMVFPLPSDFEEYITNPQCTVLVDAFKSKLVDLDPPEAQQMVKSYTSSAPPALPANKKAVSPPSDTAESSSDPSVLEGQDHLDVAGNMHSRQLTTPPRGPQHQVQGTELSQQPAPAARENGNSTVDWAAKYREAMERQQLAINILQGGGLFEDAVSAFQQSSSNARKDVQTSSGQRGGSWKGGRVYPTY
ncbi:hypothetical protein DUNSADRAFT_14958 [Dunaliella salina]|uniref:Uncharacterized protein n=1 Tax=Dunaliella salina TaxID=3046 RepID=A0ABZ3KLU2_DUNSA|nr:hypothetical protein DUNSADRAFT_14958 [Dunaliella salina]|eukprot:KAF5830140.1 hypothetical protein DUNSADRAFT_14958 [Dunaliella salina]